MQIHKPIDRRACNAGPNPRRGFTLIELLVVLVIIGILMVFAVPSFMGQIRKSRRADAVTEVHRIAQAEERFRSSNPTYTANFGSAGLRFDTANPVLTYTAPNGYHTMSVAAVTPTSYTVTALAIGAMTGDTNCRTLRMLVAAGGITYQSANAAGQTNSAPVNNSCWNRT